MRDSTQPTGCRRLDEQAHREFVAAPLEASMQEGEVTVRRLNLSVTATLSILVACSGSVDHSVTAVSFSEPTRIIDLGALVTEDLPQRVWGKRQLADFGFDRPNSFEDVEAFEPMYFVDSYYTLFNHGGPHVDAPNHVGNRNGKGIDAFDLSHFAGPATFVDASHLPQGSVVSASVVQNAEIHAGDIVLLYTGYEFPASEDEYPVYSTLSQEAALYLAELPIRALGTDALSVESISEFGRKAAEGATSYEELTPIHHAFLTRDILVFETLFHLDELKGLKDLYFVGVPLNVKGANGVPVRPVVLAY
ncbi:MAG: hypothetical protein GY769_14300 [bacterium]|nr:hypothetical protein [bacterium]